MPQRDLTQKGFTIVELLIVVIIIAILAAVTIVSFNGIQTRAYNARVADTTKQYVKAYQKYAIDNGAYPAQSGCLGETYPEPLKRCLSQSAVAECFGLGGGVAATVVNSALKPYMNQQLPSVPQQPVSCGTTSYLGIYASYNTTTGIPSLYTIFKSDISCPSMSPNVTLTTKSTDGDATLCRYTLGSPR